MDTPTVENDMTRMREIVDGLPSKAAKIRALHRAGYERAEIARFMEVRYQHVYNVLKRSAMDMPGQTGRPSSPRKWVKIGAAGRVAVPAAHLEALGLTEGSDVQVVLEDQELRIVPRDVVIARVQDLVAKHVPEGVSLVDDLIAERRREVAAEESGD